MWNVDGSARLLPYSSAGQTDRQIETGHNRNDSIVINRKYLEQGCSQFTLHSTACLQCLNRITFYMFCVCAMTARIRMRVFYASEIFIRVSFVSIWSHTASK